MNEKVILWLGRRLGPSDSSRIGPKAASLCTLRRLGLQIPPCFFLTTVAFREHLDANNLRPRIAALGNEFNARLDKTGAETQDFASLQEIRQLIIRPPLPESVREQIGAAYDQLRAVAVAVRSSATAEDLPGHSFAGQYETILGVTSLEDCLDAIKRCWASLWTERAFEYRRRNGIDHQQVEMAVIVQQQIEPQAAGVAFTLDPIKGSRSRIVIESCRGLGEALVSGKVQPDRIVLRKKNLELVRQSLAAEESSLDLPSARRLARCVRRIERRLGCPQDVEWALRDGRLWFLQARPITAIPEPKSWEDRQVWTNLNVGEVFPDVMTPATRSIIVPLFFPLFGSVFRMLGADVSNRQVAGLVAGRLYFNVNTGLAACRPLGIGADKAGKIASSLGGDQTELYDLGEADVCDEDMPDLGFRWSRYIRSWPGIVRTLVAHRPGQADRFLVEVKKQADEFFRLDVEAMGTEELIRAVLRGFGDNFCFCDLLHLLPGAVALMVLQKACRDWLGAKDPALIYRLFGAQGGIADTEAGLDLWRLAVLAHQDPATQAVVRCGPGWQDVRRQLVQAEHGREFLSAWDRFMLEHGHHCRGELELFNPRWSETPDYILNLVRNYLASLGATDPLANQQRLADERRRLTEQCRQRLKNPLRRAVFNRALRGSQKVAVDRENWKNLAVRLIAALRRILLTLGTRLRDAGVLNDRDDIFFLELPEVESVVSGQAGFDVGQRIRGRRAEYERNRSYTPPAVVVGRFDPARHTPGPVDATVKELKGMAVSPGTATGKARVILRTDDRQHVEAGEILVAPFTDPAWTPYFLPAAAVVMDQGGVLSHGAIIAREYGIPAVVNVGSASRLIRTGQTLRVDGDRGTVTILDAT